MGPRFAVGLYVLLFGSAALAFWTYRDPRLLGSPWAGISSWIFLIFVLAFAVYRLALVRAGRYPASRAFFQIGVGVLFFTLLFRTGLVRQGVQPMDIEVLLTDSDSRVRALAAEVARYRGEGRRYAPALARALEDRSETVRQQAHTSLVAITGQDLGPTDDAQAVKAWRERYP